MASVLAIKAVKQNYALTKYPLLHANIQSNYEFLHRDALFSDGLC